MINRVLEPEVMDTAEEAREYDAMDHSLANRSFVEDLLAAVPHPEDVLDLGTGTAQIPIQLCRLHATCRVLALDAAASMLEIARYNVQQAGLSQRVQLALVDAKRLPYEDGQFTSVISNSIVHHLQNPASVMGEAWRVVADGGSLFFRDLVRPDTERQLSTLVQQYAGDESIVAQKLFGDSLRAALALDEAQGLVAALGVSPNTVRQTSDRHWTWFTKKGRRDT